MKTETRQLIDALIARFNNRAEKWTLLGIETTDQPKLTYALARKKEATSALNVLEDEVKKLVKQIEKDNSTPAAESGFDFASPFAGFPKRDIPAGDPFFAPALAEWMRVGCKVYEPVTKIGAKIANLRLNNPGSGFHKRCKYLGTILNPSSEDGFETGWSENGFFEVVGERPHSADIVLRYIGLKNQEPVKCDQIDFVKIANEILAGEGKYTLQTKSGVAVQIISTNGLNEYPIIGYRADCDYPCGWTKTGSAGHFSTLDLVAVPVPPPAPKVIGWFNYYPSGKWYGPFATRAIADAGISGGNRIACIEVKGGAGL